MKLSRRQFIQGLLATVATAAVEKNGVLRPEEEIARPDRKFFDMLAHTWRQKEDSFKEPSIMIVGEPGPERVLLPRLDRIDPPGLQSFGTFSCTGVISCENWNRLRLVFGSEVNVRYGHDGGPSWNLGTGRIDRVEHCPECAEYLVTISGRTSFFGEPMVPDVHIGGHGEKSS